MQRPLRSVTIVLALGVVVACASGGAPSTGSAGKSGGRGGSPDTTTEAGRGGQTGTAPPVNVERLRSLTSGLCLPGPLPTSGNAAACRLLLGGVSPSCDGPGLSQASDADATAVEASATSEGEPLTGSVCELGQLTESSGTECDQQALPGWCYVTNGRCVGGSRDCDAVVCATGPFATATMPVYSALFLICEAPAT